jgi:hypothetical protein
MTTCSKPSASIIAAAVVEIVGSLLAVLGTAMAFLAFRFLPKPPSNPQLPPAFKASMEVMMIFFFTLAIFGIFTGAGLLRLKNWARITTLVWGGITAFFSALTLVVALFMPLPRTLNQPPGIDHSIRIIMAISYGIPLVIGIWWLMLFNRKRIAAQFNSSRARLAPDAPILPGESFPYAAPPRSAKSSCPLPVAVVAGFSILGSFSILFVFFTRLPAMIFGLAIHGPLGTWILVLAGALNLIAGIGLLLLKPWSHALSLALQFFWLSSGTVTILSPNYDTVMREAIRSSPMWTSHSFPYEYFGPMKAFSLFGLLGPVVILLILLFYRARFLEAASAANASS